jgi:oligoribonuclease
MSDHKRQPSNFVWIDLEMTGLNPEVDVILEIATIITDNQLNTIAEGPAYVIWHPDNVLQFMDEWCIKQHGKTGLTDAVKHSNISLEKAYKDTLAFIKDHCPPNTGILAGNSVWVDRQYLNKAMPEVVDFLHYRLLDVSSIKEVLKAWYPGNSHLDFKKSDSHRALEDIRESMKELAHYRTYFFIKE